jgi:hypothetical protein
VEEQGGADYDKRVRQLLLLLLLPLAAPAEEHWVRFTSGPFEVYSSAGSKEGRETLVRFEQFRHALGQVLGDDDLETPLPVRILLFHHGAPPTPEPIVRGRDRYDIVLTAGRMPGPGILASLTKLFLQSNITRLPGRLERGLVELFSTLEVNGIRTTLGRPPAHPDLDWARVHLLAVDPEYYDKLRVLTYNLRNGVDEDAAFRNAVNKSPEEIELEAQKHLAAGQFQTVALSPLAISPKDFPERPVDSAAGRLAVADLLLGDSSRAIYRELIAQKQHVAEAYEGLGMLALRAQQKEEARQDFAASMRAGSKSANCYLEYARLESDNAKALAALERAAKLNPKLAETHYLMAQRQSEPSKRVQQLKLAAKLDPRNTAYWQALAEACLNAKDFPQAEQAWRSAGQAATTPAERSRFERARLAIESQRLDWEAAERQRKADQEAREIDRLKAQARAELHAEEARANQGEPPLPPNEKVMPWSEFQPSGVASGVLQRVDCLGKRLRLVVEEDDHTIIKLLIAHPAQVAVSGGGALRLACGVQKRRVKLQYFPKPNARLATAGEVATIEFQ